MRLKSSFLLITLAAALAVSVSVRSQTRVTPPSVSVADPLPAVSGANLTALNASNLASGTVPTARVSAITGTTTNDSAAAGVVGEYATATVAVGSLVSLTTATPANITSVSLTAGDWDVWGVADYVLTVTTVSGIKTGISTTSATFGAQDTFLNLPLIAAALSDTAVQAVPPVRVSLASTTTVYLVGQGTFSVGTTGVYGSLKARRVR